ncbi:MAG: hypothetical protein KAR23_06000 [Candidatus Aenigmarchaeota archaeon]|nr:hypothetical protein [Candidatus Aenigmarchaeota archaeon]
MNKEYVSFLKKIKKSPKKIISKITKNKDIVEKILIDYPMIDSDMVSKNHLRIVLTNLKEVLDKNIEGDIVELGCNVGTTSLFIQKLLDHYKSEKKFHVYDSFEGLPEKHDKDKNNVERQFTKGRCKTKKETFIHNFKTKKLKLPIIHIGWFGKIPDDEYPEKIAFAFFDGDFYTSIIDSFNKVYPKMVPNSRITVHDYQWEVLPGVEKACTDFLKNKPEKGTMTCEDIIGMMIKK